jgi:hypothetical protein
MVDRRKSLINNDQLQPTNYKILRQAEKDRDVSIGISTSCPTPYVKQPCLFTSSNGNIAKSLNDRAFTDVRKVDESEFESFKTFLPTFWKRLFKNVRTHFEPTDYKTWNRRFDHNTRLRHDKVVSLPNYTQTVARNAFIKQEISFDSTKPPRLITGVDDTLKVAVGPYLHKLSTIIKNKLKGTDHVYAPGLTPLEMGSFIKLGEPSVNTDMSRFDSCVTERHMELMLTLYKHFNFPDYIIDILHQSIKQRLYFPNGLVVEPTVSRRSSGHPNTTLENTMLNMALHEYAFPGSRMMCGGDDVILQNVHDINLGEKRLVNLGFIPKIQSTKIKHKFYSGWFVPVDQGVCLTPFIGRQIQKLGYEFKGRNVKEKLNCLMSVYGHVPKMIELLKLCGAVKPSHDGIYNYRCKDMAVTPCSETQLTLDDIYDGLTNHLDVIINDIKHCQSNTAFNSHELQWLLKCEAE